MKEINSMEEFDTFVSENETAVVDFWAEWCGPCKMTLPLLEKVEEKADSVAFAKVNVDDNQDIAERFTISSIPYLIKFVNGKQENVNVGVTSQAKLEQFVGIK